MLNKIEKLTGVIYKQGEECLARVVLESQAKINELIDALEAFDKFNEESLVEVEREINRLRSEIYDLKLGCGLQAKLEHVIATEEISGVKERVEPSLTVNDMEKGCWYLIEYDSGNVVVIRYTEKKRGGMLGYDCRVILKNVYYSAAEGEHSRDGMYCPWDIKSIKKLA